MQIKKEEVKNALLIESEKEFLQFGFLHASVRRIVKAAGTTIGNFYNYFENKEAVFNTLVDEEYKTIIWFVKNHNNVQISDFPWEDADVSQLRELLAKMVDKIIPAVTRKLVLLLECSKGTKYEHTRSLLVELLKLHFLEHIKQYNPNYREEGIAEILAEQMVYGILLILRKNTDEKNQKHLFTEHILFCMIGSIGLME